MTTLPILIPTMAHRGLSSLAPENTLVAFQRAVELGCQWIEIDVQLSADDVPMVIHDHSVNRCTNSKGKVSELTLQQLKQLDAGLWFADEFEGEPIPTLAETLALTQAANVNLNIELKLYPHTDIDRLCHHVAEVINEMDIDPQTLLFSSFSTHALQCIKQYLPDVRRGQLWQSIPYDAASVLTQIDAYSVHCDYRFLTQAQAKAIKQMGYQLYCYTPNFPELVEPHRLWGVDMMITDVPQRYTQRNETHTGAERHAIHG